MAARGTVRAATIAKIFPSDREPFAYVQFVTSISSELRGGLMRQASIFVVEDETLIRMMLVQIIEELGHRVIAEASNVEDGRSLAEIEEYDLAILDINLQGFNVRPVAQAITQRGLPFFFLTGYGSRGVPDGFKGLPVLDKPCTPEALRCTIDSALLNREPRAQDDNGRASQT